MLLGVYEPELGPDGSLALPQHYLCEAKDGHIFARAPQEPGPILLFAFRQEAFFLPEDEQENEQESLGEKAETLVLPRQNPSGARRRTLLGGAVAQGRLGGRNTAALP